MPCGVLFVRSIVQPIGVGVPVKLAKASGLEMHDGSGDVSGGKVFAVDDLDVASGCDFGGLHFSREERE